MFSFRRSNVRRPANSQGGFTLIELLVVIIVLGILAGIVVFAVRGADDKGKDAAIQTDERTIRTALEVFCARNNRYPGGPAAGAFATDPMGELVAGKYLSNPSEHHKLTTEDNTTEGKCTNTPKNFKLEQVPPGSDDPPPQQPFDAVAAGLLHSLRLAGDGKVFASGHNGGGELGDGTTTNRQRPVQVLKDADTPFEGVNAVAAGDRFSLALKDDATVWAWGRDFNGELGNGVAGSSSTPVQVLGENGSGFLTGVTAIEAGSTSSHALALRNGQLNGEVWAWGRDVEGQVGNGSDGVTHKATPVQVKDENNAGNLNGVTAIAAGRNHSLAVKDGKVWAWGKNSDRQLGDNSTMNRTEPVEVQGLGGSVTAIAAGSDFSVALTEEREVWVWGKRPGGVGTTAPEKVKGSDGNPFGGVTAIAAGGGHVLASKNGEVWAWGDILGNNSTTPSATPVRVKGFRGVGDLDGATDLSASHAYSLAVSDGRVLAWGSNQNGQFGTGDWEGSLVPTDESDETPPTNDAFAPDPLTGAGGRIVLPPNHPGLVATTGTNMFASPPEAGETSHGGPSAGKSVWYEWTVPNSVVINGGGNATFYTKQDPSGTESSNFDTTIAAYVTNDPLNPPSVSKLTPVDLDRNDNSSPGEQSRVTVPATPGVVYFIAIDGRSGTDFTDQGGIKLTSYIYPDPRKPCGGPC